MSDDQEQPQGDRRSLGERRADQRKLSPNVVAQLRDETANLADQLHKIRGTLAAYAPRKEMERTIDKRLEAVEKHVLDDVEATRQETTRRRRRGLSAVIVAVLVSVHFQDLHMAVCMLNSPAESARTMCDVLFFAHEHGALDGERWRLVGFSVQLVVVGALFLWARRPTPPAPPAP